MAVGRGVESAWFWNQFPWRRDGWWRARHTDDETIMRLSRSEIAPKSICSRLLLKYMMLSRAARAVARRGSRACSSSSSSSSSSAAAASAVPQPTALQLRRHALTMAVPMVGFGFMDNLVMIQAGDLIGT